MASRRVTHCWCMVLSNAVYEVTLPSPSHPQSAEVKQRLQVLLDAKMTLDEALQLRCSPGRAARDFSRAETCSRKPASAIMRQPLAAADAAELLLASAGLGLVDGDGR
jgi:hypothetical protein